MPLDRFQRKSIREFEEIMDGRSQDYAYTGSAAIALHGIDIYPEDIDIIASEEAFDKINELFPEDDYPFSSSKNAGLLSQDKIKRRPEKLSKTTYSGKAHGATAERIILGIGSTEFEILKNGKYRLKDGFFNLNNCNIETVDYKEDKLDIVGIKDLKEIYSLGGRDEKADMIQNYIMKQKLEEKEAPKDPIEYLKLDEDLKYALMEQRR